MEHKILSEWYQIFGSTVPTSLCHFFCQPTPPFHKWHTFGMTPYGMPVIFYIFMYMSINIHDTKYTRILNNFFGFPVSK